MAKNKPPEAGGYSKEIKSLYVPLRSAAAQLDINEKELRAMMQTGGIPIKLGGSQGPCIERHRMDQLLSKKHMHDYDPKNSKPIDRDRQKPSGRVL